MVWQGSTRKGSRPRSRLESNVSASGGGQFASAAAAAAAAMGSAAPRPKLPSDFVEFREEMAELPIGLLLPSLYLEARAAEIAKIISDFKAEVRIECAMVRRLVPAAGLGAMLEDGKSLDGATSSANGGADLDPQVAAAMRDEESALARHRMWASDVVGQWKKKQTDFLQIAQYYRLLWERCVFGPDAPQGVSRNTQSRANNDGDKSSRHNRHHNLRTGIDSNGTSSNGGSNGGGGGGSGGVVVGGNRQDEDLITSLRHASSRVAMRPDAPVFIDAFMGGGGGAQFPVGDEGNNSEDEGDYNGGLVGLQPGRRKSKSKSKSKSKKKVLTDESNSSSKRSSKRNSSPKKKKNNGKPSDSKDKHKNSNNKGQNHTAEGSNAGRSNANARDDDQTAKTKTNNNNNNNNEGDDDDDSMPLDITFRSSTQRKNWRLRHLPANLHLQVLTVGQVSVRRYTEPALFSTSNTHLSLGAGPSQLGRVAGGRTSATDSDLEGMTDDNMSTTSKSSARRGLGFLKSMVSSAMHRAARGGRIGMGVALGGSGNDYLEVPDSGDGPDAHMPDSSVMEVFSSPMKMMPRGSLRPVSSVVAAKGGASTEGELYK